MERLLAVLTIIQSILLVLASTLMWGKYQILYVLLGATQAIFVLLLLYLSSIQELRRMSLFFGIVLIIEAVILWLSYFSLLAFITALLGAFWIYHWYSVR